MKADPSYPKLHLYQPAPSPVRDWLLTRLRGPRVLDVGCGVGYMGQSRPDLRWTGIDINPEACQEAAHHYEAVLCGSAADTASLADAKGTFDEAVCCDILEHFEDPERVLREISSLLEPDGRILVAIPNVVHWAVRKTVLLGHWDYADEGPLDRTHLRFFTLSTARQLLLSAGLRVTETGASIVAPRALRWARPVVHRQLSLFSSHLLAVCIVDRPDRQ